MPPAKKQKTGKKSSAPTQEPEPESTTPHKNAAEPKIRDTTKIPLYEYVCIHRPHFEYEVENRQAKEPLEEDKLRERYEEQFQEAAKSGKILEPAGDHPEWKWVILWEGFKNYGDYKRRSKYCNPDGFGMYIYNDFAWYGLMELLENLLLAYDAALKKKGDDALKQMWAPLSALAFLLSEGDLPNFIMADDSDKVVALSGLMGYALLRGLAALDHADEIKTDTAFLDLPLVITYFLEWSAALPESGIEGEAVEWRPHAAAYFTKAGFEPERGLPGTKELIEKAEPSDASKLPAKKEKDPWGWNKRFKEYKSLHGTPKIGGTNYDITKMTRQQRAGYAFDEKDPLADIAIKDLKEGNLFLE